MSFAGLNTAHNYSFYAIPIGWVLSMAPHIYALALYSKESAPGTSWNFSNPKKNLSTIKEAKLSPVMEGKFLRAEAANDNGFQSLPLFAAAIIAGNIARIEPKALNTVATIYLVSRAIYNALYINGTTQTAGFARTVSWLVGSLSTLSLFVQAGNKFYSGYAAF